jgi:hypothetical protein
MTAEVAGVGGGVVGRGMWVVRVVPCPGGLVMVRVPSTAAMRSVSPVSPLPLLGLAPPMPSSVMVRVSWLSWWWAVLVLTSMVMVVAWAYLAVLVRASATTK